MGLYYSNMKFIFMYSQQRHVFETIVFVIKITGSAPDTSPTILMIKNILLKDQLDRKQSYMNNLFMKLNYDFFCASRMV